MRGGCTSQFAFKLIPARMEPICEALLAIYYFNVCMYILCRMLEVKNFNVSLGILILKV